jgi:signal transduction histidine kinase
MRAYEMIADMMLFARPPRPELQPVELIAFVDQLVADLIPRCARQETSVRRIGRSDPIHIQADPVQLQVALRAICQNATEVIGNGGQIEIEILECGDSSPLSHECQPKLACSEGEGTSFPTTLKSGDESPHSKGEVLISIHDDGPGITPKERRHIFDPFYSARQAGRGLGMGLSKAWRIVTNHGGRIDVDSDVGQGATFTIRLPLNQDC